MRHRYVRLAPVPVLLGVVCLPVVGGTAYAAVPGCESLEVAVGAAAPGGVTLAVTVPAALGGVDLTDSAFRLVQGTTSQPVTAVQRDLRPLAVAVVLGVTDPGAERSAQDAVVAARELLAGLPAGTATTLVSASVPPQVLAPGATDPGAALAALSDVRIGNVADLRGALALAAAELPADARAHAVVLSPGRSPAPIPRTGELTLHDIALSGGSVGCPGASGAGLIAGVDAVVSRLRGAYTMTVPRPKGPAKLVVDDLGVVTSADLPRRGAPAQRLVTAPVPAEPATSWLPFALGCGVLLAGGAALALRRLLHATATRSPDPGPAAVPPSVVDLRDPPVAAPPERVPAD